MVSSLSLPKSTREKTVKKEEAEAVEPEAVVEAEAAVEVAT